jgi:hypothetical protein
MRGGRAVAVVCVSAVLLLGIAAPGGVAALERASTLPPAPLPKPPPGRATIGGKVVALGRPVPREDVSLYVRSKEVAKAKTGPRGNFLFRAVKPGTYTVAVGLTVPQQNIPASAKSCSVAGFPPALSIGGTTSTGEDVLTVAAESARFKVKAGDRIAKDVVFSCR